MINTVIFSIFSICLLAGLVFLFALLVKALKKYINSDKTHTHTSNEESERKHQNIIKTFTFWFVIVAIIGIVLNLTGIDDIGLLLASIHFLTSLAAQNLPVMQSMAFLICGIF